MNLLPRRTRPPFQATPLKHRPTRNFALALAVASLGGCGGGSVSTAPTAAVQPSRALAAASALAVTPEAKTKGVWGPVQDWPLIPVHSVLMPDGRVMTYGSRADGSSTAFFSADIWEGQGPASAGHLSFPNGTGTDFFCSSQLLLPPANASSVPAVFIAGGDTWNGTRNTFIGNNRSTVFDSASNALIRGNDMAQPRWYSTSTTLVNGETYIQGGSGGAARPEVRQVDGSFRPLTNVDTNFLVWSYPRNFVMPDGKLFGYDFEGRMYFVDTSGAGSLAAKNILPLQYFGAGTAALFRPGRILQVGGHTNASAVIDVTSGAPVFTPTQSSSTVRKLATATLLADGQVLLTGGSPVWNELRGANRAAEIWNPKTGQWSLGAEGARTRLYHSNALMLPDATVLVGGGGAPAPEGADPAGERNVEIYHPPYLFAADGSLAPRPVVASAPNWLEIGKAFGVQTNAAGGVSRVTLVKTGSVTHGYNLDQRFMDLSFSQTTTAAGQTLAVNAPARAGEATPGYYMLFIFDAAGVPSVAHMMRLGIAGPVNTLQAPRLTPLGNQVTTAGDALALTLAATDPNGDALTFSAAGLPPGLTLDAASGRIAGAPTQPGNFDVVLSVSDGTHTHGTNLVWTVVAPTPLQLTLEPTPGASLVGSGATFAAAANGVGVEFAWNFGDGSGVTAWSPSANINKVYDRPGTYTVTLFVRDSAGATVSRSFWQTVYLGNGDKASRASSNLVIETPLLGSDRLWVVNQDNDSITGFDTQTNERLAEVAVGAAPRSIAVDVKGLLWVTNKGDASISIVDPSARSVLRSIALPRGSQPFGVVISPVDARAYVALEGSGELLRFDTETFTQTGSLNVGPQVRQVSVLGNGKTVYVTRFITPPFAGESTLTVNVAAAQGGEVLVVDAPSMTLSRVITLAHSNRPDAESQGSGIPNYLGAMAISPDASQAYVPSKQDNILRGSQRNGLALNFQNTVRAISSHIPLLGPTAGAENAARRVDHDNASVASAAVYDRRGALLFVALETSQEVAVLDAHSGAQLMRFAVGRAPQGMAVSADGYTLYVHNFMDRSVGAYDLHPLLNQGLASVPLLTQLPAVLVDRLSPTVLLGKQLFYDARDPRLARDRYMSCASCHNDGGADGRVWDMGHAGEGLRNTISLRGRAGAQGRLHWSGNFDEVQDFEAQIRGLAGGSGLMADAVFLAGTRSLPLGDSKAGFSSDLDALAAYLGSLDRFAPSPQRPAADALSAQGSAGKLIFADRCASCHAGTTFSDSEKKVLHNVGTAALGSGQRLGATLAGLDVPTLRDAWSTAPYLHNGAAQTLEAAIAAHTGLALTPGDLASVVSYVRQIGGDEPSAPTSTANLVMRALTTLVDSVGAWFEVRVNGSVVGAGQLDSRTWVDLFFDVARVVQGAVVEVIFKNDAYNASEDRNLAVQSLTFNGTTTLAAATSGAVLDGGSGPRAFDGLNITPVSSTGGWMPGNAALRLTVPALENSSTITLRARSTLVGGTGAQIELRLNGVLLATQLVASTTLTDTVFSTPAVSVGDRIDIVFINDASSATEDRNLHVESITARGLVLPSNGPSVVIDQGSGSSAFDGLTLVPASATGGWVPWNGALRFTAQ